MASPTGLSKAWVLVASLLVWVQAEAVSVPDQGRIFGTDGFVPLGTAEWLQTFRTGINGQLTGIQFQFDPRSIALPGEFRLELIASPGDDSEQALVSQTLSLTPEDLVDPELYTWDLTAWDLRFAVGDRLGFKLVAASSGFVIAGNDPPGYADGALFRDGLPLPSTEPNDIAFISYVLPIASPAPEEPPWTIGKI